MLPAGLVGSDAVFDAPFAIVPTNGLRKLFPLPRRPDRGVIPPGDDDDDLSGYSENDDKRYVSGADGLIPGISVLLTLLFDLILLSPPGINLR